MTTTLRAPEPEPAAPAGYIRGGGGVSADASRVLRVAGGVCLGLLAALTIALTVGAFHQDARQRELQQHGVAVRVTVTSCLGSASGTGITVNGFTCRGSFALDGHRYVDVIGGSSALLRRGSALIAVADPRSTSTLSTEPAAAVTTASWRPFLRPGISLAALLAVAACGRCLPPIGDTGPVAGSTSRFEESRDERPRAIQGRQPRHRRDRERVSDRN